MSERVHPSKYFVPAVPPQYISDFGEKSDSTEAIVLRLLLQADSSASKAPAIVVNGFRGTGKTTALFGVGNDANAMERFRDAIWFISLGQDASLSAVLEDLETVVRAVVGTAEADEIGRRPEAKIRPVPPLKLFNF